MVNASSVHDPFRHPPMTAKTHAMKRAPRTASWSTPPEIMKYHDGKQQVSKKVNDSGGIY